MNLSTIQRFRLTRLCRFLTGGGFATLIHWLVMFLLIDAGVDARVATAAGATVGLGTNYLAQHRYTFRSELPHRLAFPRYLATSSAGWALNLAAFSTVYATTNAPLASQVTATAVATIANYFLAEKFIFQKEQANDIH